MILVDLPICRPAPRYSGRIPRGGPVGPPVAQVPSVDPPAARRTNLHEARVHAPRSEAGREAPRSMCVGWSQSTSNATQPLTGPAPTSSQINFDVSVGARFSIDERPQT